MPYFCLATHCLPCVNPVHASQSLADSDYSLSSNFCLILVFFSSYDITPCLLIIILLHAPCPCLCLPGRITFAAAACQCSSPLLPLLANARHLHCCHLPMLVTFTAAACQHCSPMLITFTAAAHQHLSPLLPLLANTACQRLSPSLLLLANARHLCCHCTTLSHCLHHCPCPCYLYPFAHFGRASIFPCSFILLTSLLLRSRLVQLVFVPAVSFVCTTRLFPLLP